MGDPNKALQNTVVVFRIFLLELSSLLLDLTKEPNFMPETARLHIEV